MEKGSKNGPERLKMTFSSLDKESFYHYEEIYHPGCCIHQGAEVWGWRISIFWGGFSFRWVYPDRPHCGAAFHDHPWHGMNTRL